jgi:hypothetical protein
MCADARTSLKQCRSMVMQIMQIITDPRRFTHRARLPRSSLARWPPRLRQAAAQCAHRASARLLAAWMDLVWVSTWRVIGDDESENASRDAQ